MVSRILLNVESDGTADPWYQSLVTGWDGLGLDELMVGAEVDFYDRCALRAGRRFADSSRGRDHTTVGIRIGPEFACLNYLVRIDEDADFPWGIDHTWTSFTLDVGELLRVIRD